jgi:hypothetical protein
MSHAAAKRQRQALRSGLRGEGDGGAALVQSMTRRQVLRLAKRENARLERRARRGTIHRSLDETD